MLVLMPPASQRCTNQNVHMPTTRTPSTNVIHVKRASTIVSARSEPFNLDAHKLTYSTACSSSQPMHTASILCTRGAAGAAERVRTVESGNQARSVRIGRQVFDKIEKSNVSLKRDGRQVGASCNTDNTRYAGLGSRRGS